MTRFGEISSLWQSLEDVGGGLFRIGQNVEPTLAKKYAIRHLFISKLGQLLRKQYSHLVILLVVPKVHSKLRT